MSSKSNDTLIYEDKDGTTKIMVKFYNDSIWLTTDSIAAIYKTSVQNIEQQIKNIYIDRELLLKKTCKKFTQSQKENRDYYNLDMIISLGYFIYSDIAVRFRIWVAKKLHEYIQNGFILDDDNLK